MPRFELLEAIHPSDVSQIAPGEVVSCNYLPNPALSGRLEARVGGR
jgi:hypothetical protein